MIAVCWPGLVGAFLLGAWVSSLILAQLQIRQLRRQHVQLAAAAAALVARQAPTLAPTSAPPRRNAQ